MKKIVKLTESDLVRLVKRVINEDISTFGFDAKDGNVLIDNKYKYRLEGYGGVMVGWLTVPVVSLTPSGADIIMEYKKPPMYGKNKATIPKKSIDFVKSKLGETIIKLPHDKLDIRLVKL